MRKWLFFVITVTLIFGGVKGCTTTQGYQGAGVGAALGGVTGALVNKKNPWRGAVIGAGIGAIFGGVLSELAAKAAEDTAKMAAHENKPVRAETRDGYVIVAEPKGSNQQTKCKKVRERIWKDEKLLGDKIVEVCEGTSKTNVY